MKTPKLARNGKMRAPRSTSEIERMPLCDGQPLASEPTAGGEALWRVQNEFVASYHLINQHYAKLCASRNAGPLEVDQPFVHRLLQKIEAALVAKENLENHYAARGISVIPVYRDGFAIDLLFQHPGKAKYLVAGSSASRFVTLPLPPGFHRARRRRPR